MHTLDSPSLTAVQQGSGFHPLRDKHPSSSVTGTAPQQTQRSGAADAALHTHTHTHAAKTHTDTDTHATYTDTQILHRHAHARWTHMLHRQTHTLHCRSKGAELEFVLL